MLVDLLKMSKILMDFLSLFEKSVDFFAPNTDWSKSNSVAHKLTICLSKLSWITLQNYEISKNSLQINITALYHVSDDGEQ